MTGHVILLGDSIFDNAAYVPGGPAVQQHLQRMLPPNWKATLAAIDGATVASVFSQLERVPATATHLVLSVGGNDALGAAGDIFATNVKNVGLALSVLAELRSEFQAEYQRLVRELRSRQLPLTICTIYDRIPGLAAAESAGLCYFNDVITCSAFAAGATLIDLRNLCHENSDYAAVSPIEPSASGGAKIARAIIDAVLGSEYVSRVIT